MSIVITGFWYAIGSTLSVWMAGLDCGDYVVAADGTITVPYQSDPDLLLTATYLKGISDAAPDGPGLYANSVELVATITVTIAGVPTDVVVPMVVGFNYASKGQLVRPNQQAQAKAARGPTLGEKRRINQFAALLPVAQTMEWGTDFDHMRPSRYWSGNQNTLLSGSVAFDGVFRDTIDSTTDFDNMLCWQTTRPAPAMVAAIEGFMETSEG